MYEVEVKARLRDKNSVIKKLKELGCKFSEELHQVDRIFLPDSISSLPEPLGTLVFRVRQENDRTLFTLKITQSNYLDCIEKELEIKDGKKMIEIIKLMKFKEFPKVDKKRIKTRLKGVEIVLDTVRGLGDFIEAEKIVTEKDPAVRKKMQGWLMEFLGKFGIKKEDQIIDGKYPTMLFEKFGMPK
jgi:adenylate cyclase class 2